MACNASLREVMRWMNRPEPVTHAKLREMVMTHLLANETDMNVSEAVTKDLVRAYLTALAEYEEENDKQYPRVTEQAAMDLFRKEYVNGYHQFFPNSTAEYITQDVSWPDLLPYHVEYTTSFIKEVGFAFGYHWGRWSQGAQEYMQSTKAESK